MRVLIATLAICLAAGAARAQQDTDWGPGSTTRFTTPGTQHVAPGGVRQQAEDAVKAQLPGASSVAFHGVATQVVTSVRRGFEDRIAGPVSIVCGQYATKDPEGGPLRQAWFFVPIKHSKILWSDVDPPGQGPGDAYLSCKNAGLAN
ncbi:MAG TPA: hypothetical protein VHS81_09250 [Caulobacteraceae bacterium]|nr:hypothetical protein [Caulobacteraceae bacterium]